MFKREREREGRVRLPDISERQTETTGIRFWVLESFKP